MSNPDIPIERILDSPFFTEYAERLERSAKPECRGCGWLDNCTAAGAAEIIGRAALVNKNGEIVALNKTIADVEFAVAQSNAEAYTEDCPGITIIDTDYELLANIHAKMRQLFGGDYPESREPFPLSERCGNPSFIAQREEMGL